MPRPEWKCGLPNASRTASIALATRRQCGFGSLRTSRRKDAERSICKIGLDIAAVSFDLAPFPFTPDLSICAFYKAIEFFFGHAILAKPIIVGVNGYRSKSDDFVAMHDANVLAIGCALQKRRKIDSCLRRRKGDHARYYDDIASKSNTPQKISPPIASSAMARPALSLSNGWAR